MKKRNLKSLALNKKSVSKLNVKGGHNGSIIIVIAHTGCDAPDPVKNSCGIVRCTGGGQQF